MDSFFYLLFINTISDTVYILFDVFVSFEFREFGVIRVLPCVLLLTVSRGRPDARKTCLESKVGSLLVQTR